MYLANANANAIAGANQPQYADYKSNAYQSDDKEYQSNDPSQKWISKTKENPSENTLDSPASQDGEAQEAPVTNDPAPVSLDYRLFFISIYDGYILPFFRREDVLFALEGSDELIRDRRKGKIEPHSFRSWEPAFKPDAPNTIDVYQFARIVKGFHGSEGTLVGKISSYTDFISTRIYNRPFFYHNDADDDIWYLGMLRYSPEKRGDVIDQYAVIKCPKFDDVANAEWYIFSWDVEKQQKFFCYLAHTGYCKLYDQCVTVLDENFDEIDQNNLPYFKNEDLEYLLKLGPAVKRIGNLFGVDVDIESRFPPSASCFGRDSMKAFSLKDGHEIPEKRKTGVALSRKVARKIIRNRRNGKLSSIHSFLANQPAFDPNAPSVLSTKSTKNFVAGFFSSHNSLTGKIMTYDELVSMRSYNHPFMYYEDGVYYLAMLRSSKKQQADIVEQYAAIKCNETSADGDYEVLKNLVCWHHECRFDPKTVIVLDETYDDMLTLEHPKPAPESTYPSFKKMAATTLIFGTLFGLPLMQAIFGN